MNLNWRRNYWIVLALLSVVGLLLLMGDYRIISYNWLVEKEDEELVGNNYDNTVYLFDDSQVHDIEIAISDENYDKMIATYQETGEKDYFPADVVIDGVTIENVGVRLKGNMTLRTVLGEGGGEAEFGPGGGMGQDGPSGGFGGRGERPDLPDGMEMPEGMNFPGGGDGEGDMSLPVGMGMQMEMTEELQDRLPMLVRFDEYVAGQTYQGLSEIALRIATGDDAFSLLNEQVAYGAHKVVGQIVPETAYVAVQVDGQEQYVYVVSEVINEEYVEKHFGGDGVLYKADNFVGFDYLGDDPTLYVEKYEQKTMINDYDLKYLIEFLKFVDQSSDEEFESQLSGWLDIDLLMRMLALDELLTNNDSFGGMGSNYYLYYDLDEEKFYFLSWDMNLAMGNMGGGGQGMPGQMGFDRGEFGDLGEGMGEEGLLPEGFESPEGFNGAEGFGPGGRQGSNKLKERFMANEKYKQMYDEVYESLKKMLFDGGYLEKRADYLSGVFLDWNEYTGLMNEEDYINGLETLKDFIANGPKNESFGDGVEAVDEFPAN